jgi:hypothetical protein
MDICKVLKIRRPASVAWTSLQSQIGTIVFYVELRLSPRWVGGNIGSTDATKTYHTLNAYIFETNNRKVINNASLGSVSSPISNKVSFNPPLLDPSIE